jgi:hypothetical protein
MNRDFWGRHRDDPHRHDAADRRDFGQADYSRDYAYDPDTRTGYRVDPGAPDYDRDDREYAYERAGYRRGEEPRAFDRHESSRDRKRASHDRVIWAVVCERLDRARGLDASHIDVRVEDGVVFLDGLARNRREKRRAEELAELEGVVDIVNGLRVRGHDGGGWRRSLGF